MRSSVVESRPSRNLETQSSNILPRPEFQIPNPQRPTLLQPVTHHAPKYELTLTPSEGWLAMLLLSVAIYSVVFSIISANWVSNSFILLLSTPVGLLLGLCIAKVQRFPQSILHLAACLAGHWISIWLTSVIAFHISWLLLLENLRTVISGGLITSASPNSEVVFLFYLTFLCFFLGYFGAWLIYRAHLPWLVAFVYCAIMLVNLNFIKQDRSYLVVIMLGALILLIARIQLVNQLTQWTNEGLHTDRAWLRNISRRYVQIGSLFALSVLIIGWILPVLAQPISGADFWNSLDNVWTNITAGRLSLSNPGSIFQPYQPSTNFFSDQLTIAGDVNLPTGEVLEYTSSATPQSQYPTTRYAQYLEGFTYDHFDGHTWTSSASNENQQFFGPNARLPADITSGNYNQAITNVTIVLPPEGTKHYLFAPAQPWSFNVATRLYGNGITTAWTQQTPLTQTEQYQVTSLIPVATAQDLSTVQFPTRDNQNLWSNDSNLSTLKQYYLQIPDDHLPPSVLNTARKWTEGSTNVYSAMKSLESHLSDSNQFRYSVTNPPVPGNVDAVAWLLQTQKGYCTYYASAMTIMARLLGVPARVVNGFSQGYIDGQREVRVVSGTDAHSWVQVYFPGFGWINFDPTPGFSGNGQFTAQPIPTPMKTQSPTRQTPTATAGHQKPGPQHKPTPGTTSTNTNTTSPGALARQNLFLALSLATLFLSLVVFCFALLARCKENGLNNNTTIASTLFWRICRFGSLVGLPPRGWQTPYEYSRVLSRRFPQVAVSLRRVTELFVRERWAAPHQAPGPAEEHAVEKLWPHLRNTFVRSFFIKQNSGIKH